MTVVMKAILGERGTWSWELVAGAVATTTG